VFDELLLDADWSVNAGMWMWLSCSSFFQQFFHCYCPVGFGKRTDPNGDYIRKYLPILKNFPTKYIFEPWSAPKDVQESAKCVIGKDYPFPMIDHAESSRINIERMKQVYQKLSRYGGPGLLASVPSSKAATGPTENSNNVYSGSQCHSVHKSPEHNSIAGGPPHPLVIESNPGPSYYGSHPLQKTSVQYSHQSSYHGESMQ